jgi:hypothetical protein
MKIDYVFWEWCFEHLPLEKEESEESDHYYLGKHYVGGYDGIAREYFVGDTEMASKLVATYNEWRDYE